MKRTIPPGLEDCWGKLRSDEPLLALKACHAIPDVLKAYEGQLVNESRLAGSSWAQIGDALGITRQSAWERYEERRGDKVMKHGDVMVQLRTGEQVIVGSGQLVVPVAAGVESDHGLVEWGEIAKISRYLRRDEPHEVGFQFTRYGFELRTVISLALYPRLEDVPDGFKQSATSLARQGNQSRPWMFSQERDELKRNGN